MSALIDLSNDTKKLPPRERIVGVTRIFMGTQYLYGAKDAKPLDLHCIMYPKKWTTE